MLEIFCSFFYYRKEKKIQRKTISMQCCHSILVSSLVNFQYSCRLTFFHSSVFTSQHIPFPYALRHLMLFNYSANCKKEHSSLATEAEAWEVLLQFLSNF